MRQLTGVPPIDPPFAMPERPEPVLRAAAADGEAQAMLDLGDLAALKRDVPRALSWWTKALKADEDLAALRLAHLHLSRGDGELAASCYRRAVEAGVPGAANDYGMLLIEQGDQTGHDLLRRAADGGDASAMYNLGYLAAQRGDPAEHERWSRASAEAGNREGAFALGLLSTERGDVEMAKSWYRTAAQAQHVDAMLNLGNVLREQGDLDSAEHWYEQGAAAGDEDAARNLVLLRRQRYGR
ncbi:tetratricopeptide repeat protein [Streptomyces cyaneofuscatus]|uniref:tetratricopeptide repeat protein n=1 Tax=Streptomyces cyaneofuscatus TaxID=66883 RepID=UPI00366155F4